MATVFITGGSGFIGSRLAARLVEEGHRVRCLLRSTSDATRLKGLAVRRVEGDVRDRGSLEAGMDGAEVVIHAAARVSDWGAYRLFEEVNLQGTKNAAEAALRAGVRRFVFVSSTAVHGFPGGRYLTEDAPMPPTPFAYCETKKAAEQWLFRWGKAVPMEITAVRPGNVFGPGDRMFMGPFLQALVRGRMGYIGGGRAWTCPAFVDHVVEGIRAACFVKEAAGEAFLLTDGLEIDWRGFTEGFARVLGVPAPRLSLPFRPAYALAWMLEGLYRLARRREPPLITRYRVCNGGRDYHFSIRKAARILEYRPKVSLEEAMARTTAWFKEERVS